MGCNQSNASRVIGCTSTRVEFEDDWFAQGVSRLAYRGTYHGDSRTEGKKCVVKVYKEEWYERLEKYAWEADDRASRKADEMAQLFNIRYNTSKPIVFVRPQFASVRAHASLRCLGFIPLEREIKGRLPGTRDRASNVIPYKATVAIERYLNGDFVKFLNNSGYVNAGLSATPSAFSHFTYHQSEGKFLVCDLQGVRSQTNYELTDPAIHSADPNESYGPTDLGVFGILKFFQTHRCNELCEGLKKARKYRITPKNQKMLNTVLRNMPTLQGSSTYTYQLYESTGLSKFKIQQIQNNVHLEAISENGKCCSSNLTNILI